MRIYSTCICKYDSKDDPSFPWATVSLNKSLLQVLLRGHGSQNHHVFEKGCWFPPAKPLNIGIECFIQYYDHDSTKWFNSKSFASKWPGMAIFEKASLLHSTDFGTGRWFGPLV